MIFILYIKPFQYYVSTEKFFLQANEITEYILLSDERKAWGEQEIGYFLPRSGNMDLMHFIN